jgi:putative transposase
VKYAFIQEKLAETNNPHRLGVFCRMLDVSRSGYYGWVDRSIQTGSDTLALEVAARAAHARGRESYGPKRLRTEMAEMGFPRSLASIKRLRKQLGLRCRHKRRFVRTTDGNHALPIAPNLLEQRFNETTAPN